VKKMLFIITLLVLTACGRVDQVVKIPIEKVPPKFFDISVMENIEWIESPTFKYETFELRGIEGKVAILSTPWKVNTPNKYMIHLFGNDIPSGVVNVIAVKKDTNEVTQAIYLSDSKIQAWSPGSVPAVVNGHADIPAGMKLPSKGMWALNIYVGENLFGQIIVDVK